MIYFYSAVGEPEFMASLRRHLEIVGYKTRYKYLISNYEYWGSQGFLRRLMLRVRMYVVFPLVVFICVIKSSSTSISIITTNPFLSPLMGILGKKLNKSKTINLLWDLYPDAFFYSGMLRNTDSIFVKLLKRITRYSIVKSDVTVYLGEHLKSYVERNYGASKYSVVIPVGADAGPFINSHPFNTPKKLSFLYSGNMGRMHDVSTLLRILPELQRCDAYFNFYGQGDGIRQISKLADKSSIKNTYVGKNLSQDKWVDLMKSNHVSFITLKEGCENVVMPSKTYSSMVAGHAIIGICSKNSDLAKLIKRHNCGWIIQPGDAAGLKDLIYWASENRNDVYEKMVNSYISGHKFYSAEVVALQWKRLLDSIKIS